MDDIMAALVSAASAAVEGSAAAAEGGMDTSQDDSQSVHATAPAVEHIQPVRHKHKHTHTQGQRERKKTMQTHTRK